MPPVLAAERLRNARRINAFRLVGLLTSLALEGFFTVTVPGWIRAPLPLFAGWTVIAAALFVGGLRSEHVARAGSLAVAFVDMPMLLLLVSHIIDAMRAAGFGTDAAQLATHAALYYVGLLVLASLALDRRQLALAAVVAALCVVVLLARGGSWNTSIAVMTTVAVVMIGVMLTYASGRSTALIDRIASEQRHRERLERYFAPQVVAQLAAQPRAGRGRRDARGDGPLPRPARLHAARRGPARARGGRLAQRLPRARRGRGLRSWWHARQVPWRRAHGLLRGARAAV
jgi:hypothetical protein